MTRNTGGLSAPAPPTAATRRPRPLRRHRVLQRVGRGSVLIIAPAMKERAVSKVHVRGDKLTVTLPERIREKIAVRERGRNRGKCRGWPDRP